MKICKILPKLSLKDNKLGKFYSLVQVALEGLMQYCKKKVEKIDQSESELKEQNEQLLLQNEELRISLDKLKKDSFETEKKVNENNICIESQKSVIKELKTTNSKNHSEIKKLKSTLLKMTDEKHNTLEKVDKYKKKINDLKNQIKEQKVKEDTLLSLIKKSFDKDEKSMLKKTIEIGKKKIVIPTLDLTKIKNESEENHSENSSDKISYKKTFSEKEINMNEGMNEQEYIDYLRGKNANDLFEKLKNEEKEEAEIETSKVKCLSLR